MRVIPALILGALGVVVTRQRPLSWTEGPPLPAGRDHHVTFITQAGGRAWLHVVGGNDYRQVFADHWRTPIHPDGALDPWEAADSLPSARVGSGVAVTGRSVVVTGGKLADRSNTSEVLVARLEPDGSLGPWEQGRDLPGPRFHHSMAVSGDVVYVTGGLEAQVSVAAVSGARVGADGTPGEWLPLTPMPRPRSHHASFVYQGGLYVVAGLDGNPAGEHEPLRDVLRASIRDDGTLGDWVTVSALDSAYGTHSAALHGGYVYVLGGVENNVRWVDRIQRARLLPGGAFSPWEVVTNPLPRARAHVHQTPVLGDWIYSVAGSNARVVTAAVDVGRFSSEGARGGR